MHPIKRNEGRSPSHLFDSLREPESKRPRIMNVHSSNRYPKSTCKHRGKSASRDDNKAFSSKVVGSRRRFLTTRHSKTHYSKTHYSKKALSASSSSEGDPLLQKLEREVTEYMTQQRSQYNGWKHATWARSLIREKTISSIDKREKYIAVLHLCLHSIRYWQMDAIIHFYTIMERADFFFHIDELSASSKNKISQLHNELIKQISSPSLARATPIDEGNINGFIGLLRAISNMTNGSILIEDKNSIRNILIKITNALLIYEKPLSPFQYKEVSHYCNIIYNKKENREILNKLLKKFSTDIATLENSESQNEFFCKYLFDFTGIIKNGFVCTKKTQINLLQLISKIKFDSTITVASTGLYIITRNLENKTIALNDGINKKLTECVNCIQKRKTYLNANDSCNVARSLSILAVELNDLTKDHKDIVEFCLTNIGKNRESIRSNKILPLLFIMRNLYIANIPFHGFFNVFIDILLNNKNEIFAFRNTDLHSFYCHFAGALRFSHLKKSSVYLLELIPLFKALTKKYAQFILFANFPEKINGFHALSDIITKAYLPNKRARKLLRDLFASLNQEKSFSAMTDNQIISYLRAVASLGTLLEPDLEKHTQLFTRYAEKFIFEHDSISKKHSLLWSTLAFCAVNKTQLEQKFPNEFIMLNNAILDIYKNIEKASFCSSTAQTMQLASAWLGFDKKEKSIKQDTISSQAQINILEELKQSFPHEKLFTEYSILNLPPCDIAIPLRNIFIEVQGPHHYLDAERRYKTGKSAIKFELYKKAGIEVIEIHAGEYRMQVRSVRKCVEKIQSIISKPKFK